MDDTVLLVEDETDVVDLLRYHFKKAGFKVEITNSGDAGLAAVRSMRPDAVVLDLMLPGMTGLEVCRALKADSETAWHPRPHAHSPQRGEGSRERSRTGC
jgi:two-component system phosphate regulon response regulator PhoB